MNKKFSKVPTYILSDGNLFDRINAICSAAQEYLSVDEILSISLRNTLDLFKANRGSIFMISDNGRDLIHKASIGMNISEEKRTVKRIGQGIIGRVAELRKPIVVENITRDRRFKDYQSRKSYSHPSFICAPLMIKDKLIGVINISDKESGESFSNQDLELLDFLSNQIAVNYQHAHLNKNLKSSIEEAQSLKKQIVVQERLATLGKLAGGVAHELNNPLDGVMRYTNLALEQLDDDNPAVKEYLLEARQGLARMAAIVKSLLDCARNIPPAKKMLSVNRCLDLCLKEFQKSLNVKHIIVEKSFQKNIPDIIDYGIERVFSNLISNAVFAVSKHGKINIQTSLERGFIKITIADNGKGISEENLDKIFEPFFTTKNIDEGCGLGLTIVSEIIKQYKGHVELESKPGVGTKFTALIPME